MDAADALDLYKSRDASEKLFREDKTFLGNRTMRCQSNEALHEKIFIEFVALIIRNRIHFLLREQMLKANQKENYMTVPAAVRELEKIEIVRQTDGEYYWDYAVTATQKSILKEEIDIEVQGGAEGAHIRRARFHSSMTDARMLKKKQKFRDLKNSYVIFIYKHG